MSNHPIDQYWLQPNQFYGTIKNIIVRDTGQKWSFGMKIWIKTKKIPIIASLLCICALFVCFFTYRTYRTPDICALCANGERDRFHAPVILNLSTGQQNEMRVYDPKHPGPTHEINPIQNTGTFGFFPCAGLTGRRDTCSHTCTVDIPLSTEKLKPSLFCKSCRELLKDYAKCCFILLDFYEEDTFEIYDISKVTCYEIRDYSVAITAIEDQAELEVEVLGQVEGLTFID